MKWFFIKLPDVFHIFTVNILCFAIKSSRFYNITNYHVITWNISCSDKKYFHVITWKYIVLTIKVLKNHILERHVGAMVIIYNYCFPWQLFYLSAISLSTLQNICVYVCAYTRVCASVYSFWSIPAGGCSGWHHSPLQMEMRCLSATASRQTLSCSAADLHLAIKPLWKRSSLLSISIWINFIYSKHA